MDSSHTRTFPHECSLENTVGILPSVVFLGCSKTAGDYSILHYYQIQIFFSDGASCPSKYLMYCSFITLILNAPPFPRSVGLITFQPMLTRS